MLLVESSESRVCLSATLGHSSHSSPDGPVVAGVVIPYRRDVKQTGGAIAAGGCGHSTYCMATYLVCCSPEVFDAGPGSGMWLALWGCTTLATAPADGPGRAVWCRRVMYFWPVVQLRSRRIPPLGLTALECCRVRRRLGMEQALLPCWGVAWMAATLRHTSAGWKMKT